MEAFFSKIQEIEGKVTNKFQTTDLERDLQAQLEKSQHEKLPTQEHQQKLQTKLDSSFTIIENKINEVFIKEAFQMIEQKE